MERLAALLLISSFLLAGCTATPEPSSPGIIVETPWVRTTDGAINQTMSALFATLTNPGPTDITLLEVECAEVAAKSEIHEMVKVGSEVTMQKAKDGVTVPKESHLHLKPGGTHIMLMKLRELLPVGDEVECTMTFSDSRIIEITAPVKVFTEEEDHYHDSPGES